MAEGGRYARAVDQTLPYSWYTDPEILRREQERIFRPAWQYAGHTGQLAQPGFFATRPAAHRSSSRATATGCCAAS